MNIIFETSFGMIGILYSCFSEANQNITHVWELNFQDNFITQAYCNACNASCVSFSLDWLSANCFLAPSTTCVVINKG